MEPEPLIESSFRRLLASLDAEREQLRGAWQRLSEERDLTTEHLEKLRQETEEWCYREKLKIDNEWQRLNQLSEEMTKMWPATVEILEINCSGEHFTIPRETICGIEGSVLSEMFSDEFLHEIPRDEEGRFFLDFNPQCFGMVVEYLRNRRLRADAPLPLVPQMQKRNMELLAEAWKLWPLLKTNRLNQLHGTSLHISTQLVDQKELHIIRATHPGWQAMLSVAGFEKEKLSGLCEEARKFEGAKGVCQIANELFPKGFSCAGTETAINKLKELADSGGALQAKVLKTSGGFHTSLMEPAKAKLAQAVVELLKKQLTSPVLWEPSMQKMISSGITDFYECGPNKQIKAMMKRINPKAWGATTNVEV